MLRFNTFRLDSLKREFVESQTVDRVVDLASELRVPNLETFY